MKKEMNPMNAFPKIDMKEATRLTREGRLQEAMALLRGASATPGLGDHAPRFEAPKFDRLALKGMNLPGTNARTFTPPAGAKFEEHTYSGSAGARTYKLYVPSGYRGQPAPLVVMLHGCTQSPDDFALGTRMNDVAEAETFLVAYPAQTQAANASKCWNWFSTPHQRRDAGEPAIIAGITREIMRDHAIDESRVYIAGLSAGGAAAAIMGETYPDLYAAVGVHSGLVCGAAQDLPSALSAMRQGASASQSETAKLTPTIVFHGDRDGTVHPVNGEQVIAQAGAAKAAATIVTRGEKAGVRFTQTTHADDDGRAIFEHWVLHGGGHAWSGGSKLGSYADPAGPDASREMMRFFMLHQR